MAGKKRKKEPGKASDSKLNPKKEAVKDLSEKELKQISGGVAKKKGY